MRLCKITKNYIMKCDLNVPNESSYQKLLKNLHFDKFLRAVKTVILFKHYETNFFFRLFL